MIMTLYRPPSILYSFFSLFFIANPTWQKICLWCQSFSIDKTGQVFVDWGNCGSRCLPYSDMNQGHNDVICVFTIWCYTGHLVLCCQACQGRQKIDWLSVCYHERHNYLKGGLCLTAQGMWLCVTLSTSVWPLRLQRLSRERERDGKWEKDCNRYWLLMDHFFSAVRMVS